MLLISLLGEFKVVEGSKPFTTINTPRLQALFAYLLLHRNAPQPRQHIAFLFWPDSSEEQAQTNLRNLLLVLRRAFPDTERYILIQRRSLQWRGDSPFSLDVTEFEEGLSRIEREMAARRSADTTSAGASSSLQHAVDLYTGDLLPACYDEWILAPRERLRQGFMEALAHLVEALDKEGNPHSATLYAQRLLRHDPLQEENYRRLMRLHLGMADRAGVVSVYRQCERALRRELGVEPSDATRELLRRAEELSGHEPRGQRAKGRGKARVQGNLPAQTAAFIGREREVAQVSEQLRQSGHRLVTLTGTAGTGKTRLAIQVAAGLGTFQDGAFFVPLAALTEPEMVERSIAQALGMTEAANRPLRDTLRDHLRDKDILLVLDNFEHLLPAAGLVAALLAACPQLKVLATSRAPLNLLGEHEYPVPPMSVPGRDAPPEPDDLTQYEAVALFVERALEVSPQFALTRENARAVAEICRRLEGLPLAIELAAARIKALSPEAILSRLDRRLKLLVGGKQDLPPRQQALETAIAWSYNLLDDDEKALFRGLSVFVGGWTLEAAEKILPRDEPGKSSILEGMTSLLNKSLLIRTETRFSMLETIKEYARERLQESGGIEGLEREHARYFKDLAEEVEPHLVGARQGEWLAQLEAEHDNLRATLAWCLESGNAEWALHLTAALGRFWQYRSYFSEGRVWLKRTLDLGFALLHREAKKADETWVHDLESKIARTLHHEGFLAMRQGHYEEARALCVQSLEMCRALGDLRKEANVVVTLGNIAFHLGEYALAVQLCEEGLRNFRRVGDTAGVSYAAHSLGMLAVNQGQYTEASQMLEESLAIQRELGLKSGIAVDLLWLGRLTLNHLHDTTRARLQFEEALELSRELGNKWLEGWLLLNLGEVARYDGCYDDAQELYERSREILKQLGERTGVARSSISRAYLALNEDESASGDEWTLDLLAEALTLLREGSDKLALAQTIAGFGRYWARGGQPERGAALFAATFALQEHYGIVLDAVDLAMIERWIIQAKAGLESAEWEAAWIEGYAMTSEQAVELAKHPF